MGLSDKNNKRTVTAGVFRPHFLRCEFGVELRYLGTARTDVYFSIAPFIGALIALLMREPLTLTLVAAGSLMTLGIWLHLTEHHQHRHD